MLSFASILCNLSVEVSGKVTNSVSLESDELLLSLDPVVWSSACSVLSSLPSSEESDFSLDSLEGKSAVFSVTVIFDLVSIPAEELSDFDGTISDFPPTDFLSLLPLSIYIFLNSLTLRLVPKLGFFTSAAFPELIECFLDVTWWDSVCCFQAETHLSSLWISTLFFAKLFLCFSSIMSLMFRNFSRSLCTPLAAVEGSDSSETLVFRDDTDFVDLVESLWTLESEHLCWLSGFSKLSSFEFLTWLSDSFSNESLSPVLLFPNFVLGSWFENSGVTQSVSPSFATLSSSLSILPSVALFSNSSLKEKRRFTEGDSGSFVDLWSSGFCLSFSSSSCCSSDTKRDFDNEIPELSSGTFTLKVLLTTSLLLFLTLSLSSSTRLISGARLLFSGDQEEFPWSPSSSESKYLPFPSRFFLGLPPPENRRFFSPGSILFACDLS